MEKVIVISAKPYSIDQEHGKAINGTSLWYLNPTQKTEEGYIPLKMSVQANTDMDREIPGQIPAVFEMDWNMVAGKNNKPSFKLVHLKRVKDLDLLSLVK